MSRVQSADRYGSAPPLRDVERLSDEVSAEFLEHHAILPLGVERGELLIGTWRESLDESALDDLRVLFRAEPVAVRFDEDGLREAIRRVYGEGPTTARDLIAGLGTEPAGPDDDRGESQIDDLLAQANEAPVVRLVNLLLTEALEARASDVHLEQREGGIDVRYRVDGVLRGAPSPPAGLAPAVVSRLKVMAELDIAERRVPQDGRTRLKLRDREVDVRVSTVPVLHGESVVLRLLDKRRGRIPLEDLGMAPDTLEGFRALIGQPDGIVLVTGPTGSGKTTTLYAALEHLRTGEQKILTVEDPVEYELEGVAQVPVRPAVGLTFSVALRSLLRQDPDILLVGEIRDRETAEIAVHAALTGHLVLSTLHTNDAAGAVARLTDLGVEEYLIRDTLRGVLAQRLVRVTCSGCAVERPPTLEEARVLGAMPDGPGDPSLARVRIGEGCDACGGTGFRGRTGIYELLDLTGAASGTDDFSASSLRSRTERDGLRGLRGDGIRLVREGATTPGEIVRVSVVGTR